MDELEQSDLGKETNDSHNTFCQDANYYKEREKAFIKNYSVVKSVQSTLSHLKTISVPRAMFTHCLVKHGLSQYYLS